VGYSVYFGSFSSFSAQAHRYIPSQVIYTSEEKLPFSKSTFPLTLEDSLTLFSISRLSPDNIGRLGHY